MITATGTGGYLRFPNRSRKRRRRARWRALYQYALSGVRLIPGRRTHGLSNGDRVEMGDVMQVFDANAEQSSDSSAESPSSGTDDTVSNSDADSADDQQ